MNYPEVLDADHALVRKIEARLVRGRALVLRQIKRAYSGLHTGANLTTVLVALAEIVSTPPIGPPVAVDP